MNAQHDFILDIFYNLLYIIFNMIIIFFHQTSVNLLVVANKLTIITFFTLIFFINQFIIIKC
jgi:hypothetical protein